MCEAMISDGVALNEEDELLTRDALRTHLDKATLAVRFLRTNSFTYSSPFHAIAELCDNAYDANAKNFHIDLDEKEGVLKFADDGQGMSLKEMRHIYEFGYSNKRTKGDSRIGHYGNGLKSGGLYLGKELFVITKKNKIYSVFLVSHKLHEEYKFLDSVYVPCGSFHGDGEPHGTSQTEKQKQLKLLIDEFAPLGGRTLSEWFQDIPGVSGTVIVIGGLKKSVTGELCFNTSKPVDFQLDGENEPSKRSLRKYLETLYLEPRMKIYLRKEIVDPRKMSLNWMFICKSTFKAKCFGDEGLGDRLASEQRERKEAVARLDEKKFFSYDEFLMRKELRKQFEDGQAVEKKLEQVFEVHMGVNIREKQNYGMNFYINNRLIVENLRDVPFYDEKHSNNGISLYINMSYSALMPTQNKQGFENNQDFKNLLRICEKHLVSYKKHLIEKSIPVLLKKWRVQSLDEMSGEELWTKFWNKMGYENPKSASSVQGWALDEMQTQEIGYSVGFWKICEDCRNFVEYRTPQPVGKITCSSVSPLGCRRTQNCQLFENLCVPEDNLKISTIQEDGNLPINTEKSDRKRHQESPSSVDGKRARVFSDNEERETSAREKFLESAVNQILVHCGQAKLEPNEVRDINVTELIKVMQTTPEATQRMRKTDEVFNKLLGYTQSLPSNCLEVPQYKEVPEILETVAEQLQKLNVDTQ